MSISIPFSSHSSLHCYIRWNEPFVYKVTILELMCCRHASRGLPQLSGHTEQIHIALAMAYDSVCILYNCLTTLIARFMGKTWGPSGSDRTQMGPMLAPWTLLSWKVRVTNGLVTSKHTVISQIIRGLFHCNHHRGPIIMMLINHSEMIALAITVAKYVHHGASNHCSVQQLALANNRRNINHLPPAW